MHFQEEMVNIFPQKRGAEKQKEAKVLNIFNHLTVAGLYIVIVSVMQN